MEKTPINFNEKKGFICDMDGVIYHGNRILPGVAEFIQWLHDEDKEYLFLTNHRRAFQPLLYKALRRFFVQKGRGRSLFVPLFPSAHFPVWVTVWVKQLSGRERGAHLRQRQTKPLRPVPLIGDAGHFFNKAFLLRCGACPTHTVFAAQLKEYLIKTFFLCIFAAIPRRIRRRSDFIHIHAKHLLAENQSR